MKSSVTAATDLSPSEGRSPVLSGENVPLIDIESADNTPSPQMTTVVIESEWMSRTVEPSTRQVHFAGIPRKSRITSHSELALNPLSLAAHDSSSASLISPLPKRWSAGFDADNSWISKVKRIDVWGFLANTHDDLALLTLRVASVSKEIYYCILNMSKSCVSTFVCNVYTLN